MSTETTVDTKVRLREPTLYKVLLLNDDYTPQQFVVDILTDVFHKTEAEAYDLMMQVHRKGKGLAGIFTKEIAEQKVMEVSILARHHQHPLATTFEPA